jgi:flavin reductase (DIM6/NTAB) family NADH-FMN oxidoreductase RutF
LSELKEHCVAFDSSIQRHIMGCFATGVTVVTTRAGEQLSGLTANAVASLSLNPPLVLVSVDRNAHSHALMVEGRCFAMNILSIDQEHLSRRFSTPGPKDFSDLAWNAVETGAPVLDGVLSYVDCRVVEIVPGGDHDIFVGEIVAGNVQLEGEPLIYFRGRYRRLAD